MSKSKQKSNKTTVDEFEKLMSDASTEIAEAIRKEDEHLHKVVEEFLAHETLGCPFCGDQPGKELGRSGTSQSEAKALRDTDEYKEDKEYRRAVEDLIAKDKLVVTFRLRCRNEECLYPNTGFIEDSSEVFTKWEKRYNGKSSIS